MPGPVGMTSPSFLARARAEKVRGYLAAKPFTLRLDPAMSLQHAVRNLLSQAAQRQRSEPGATILGALLHYLVGAKISVVAGDKAPPPRPHSAADEQARLAADFSVGAVAIHVTVSPYAPVIEKCRWNLEEGFRPVIVTLPEKVGFTSQLAEQHGLQDRVEVLDIVQFLSSNFLNDLRLPGTPDFVFRSRKAVIFVHGCFWHCHRCKRGHREPKSNVEYWRRKIRRNKARDKLVRSGLRKLGWRCVIVWECQLRDMKRLQRRLKAFLGPPAPGLA